MLKLSVATHWWPNDDFATLLAREIEGLPHDALPLHRALTQGGRIDDHAISVTVLRIADVGDSIEAKLGIMFVETVGGCSCGDEPVDHPGYCELRLLIDKATGRTQVDLIPN